MILAEVEDKSLNPLYPRYPLARLPTMLGIAALGAVVAGTYGALHDQISYAISPEYFHRLKFRQFDYADFGWPPRVFASEVGFLATAGVGFCAGWFLARAGLAEIPPPRRQGCVIRAFAIALGRLVSAASSAACWACGPHKAISRAGANGKADWN
ncbi:MAG: hypothetical protein QM811_30010 [Pirellulales bacterium]